HEASHDDYQAHSRGLTVECSGCRVSCSDRNDLNHRRGKMLTYRAGVGAVLAVLIAAVPVTVIPTGIAQAAPTATASPVAALTGVRSINETEARYQVKGTDLGIMWTDERGQILVAFGDTFGAGWNGFSSGFADPVKIDWRSNTLARSSDHNPARG